MSDLSEMRKRVTDAMAAIQTTNDAGTVTVTTIRYGEHGAVIRAGSSTLPSATTVASPSTPGRSASVEPTAAAVAITGGSARRSTSPRRGRPAH